jgi:hypothetical protein
MQPTSRQPVDAIGHPASVSIVATMAICSPLDSCVQIREPELEVCLVVLSRQSTYTGRDRFNSSASRRRSPLT